LNVAQRIHILLEELTLRRTEHKRALQIPIKNTRLQRLGWCSFQPPGKKQPPRRWLRYSKSYQRPSQGSGQSQTTGITSCVPAVQPPSKADLLPAAPLLKHAAFKASTSWCSSSDHLLGSHACLGNGEKSLVPVNLVAVIHLKQSANSKGAKKRS